MDIKNIALFHAMGAKMDYLGKRQEVISQNIANADTPDYRPYDLTEVDFGSVLKDITGSQKIRMEKTSPGHMLPGGEIDDPKNRKSRLMYEVAPDDNGVIIEEQMIKASQTTMDYNLMTNLMRKNLGMIQIAIGQGQR